MKFDLAINNGLVYDGSGREPVEVNIGLRAGMIACISRDRLDAARQMDAKGLAVSPGFIDAHGHSGFYLLADGQAESKVLQGVTTEIGGNCGLSVVPLRGEYLEVRREEMKTLGIDEEWESLSEYRRLLEHRGISINFATLCGHGNLRGGVIGFREGEPGENDLHDMRELLQVTLREGAIGLSTGLIYPPGIFSDTEELIRLASCLDGKRHIYTTHMRSEGDALLEAVEEAGEIGLRAKVPVHISHLKCWGSKNWGKIEALIEKIVGFRNQGLLMTADRYPYTASSTDLDAVLPAWAHEGGRRGLLEKLQEPETRRKMEAALRKRDNEDWSRITISSVSSKERQWMEGKSLFQISEALDKRPEYIVVDLLLEERLMVQAIFFVMSEENLRRIYSLPFVMVGTDSTSRPLVHGEGAGLPHPRGFGTFPRFIGRYARDEGLLSLQEAVRRCTGLVADTFRLKGRGYIREGCFADLVIFDPSSIIDRADYVNPFQSPTGIEMVIVNGEVVAEGGEHTGRFPGRFIS